MCLTLTLLPILCIMDEEERRLNSDHTMQMGEGERMLNSAHTVQSG